MSDFIRFSLRIPNELHDDLKSLSDKDMRSLNSYIVLALENHVDRIKDENESTIIKENEIAYNTIDFNSPETQAVLEFLKLQASVSNKSNKHKNSQD